MCHFHWEVTSWALTALCTFSVSSGVADRFDLLRQFCVIHWFPCWTGISLCTGLESDFASSCISTFPSTL